MAAICIGCGGVGVSNIPLIKFLVELGASVTAFDKNTEEKLGSIVAEFKEQGVEFQLGKNYLDKLTGFDVVFKTPSMRIDNKALVKAKEEGAYITSEMEEFVRYCKGKIYGVTGSDGKTTTTTIISKLLEAQGYKTWVGGNIGTPLFSKIEEIKEDDMVVLELSSFQLMTMNLPIDVAVVTNLAPNHLDMHKDMEEYINAKKNIFLHQESKDILVLNCENEIDTKAKEEMFAKFYMLDEEDVNPVREQAASLTVDEIEKELSVIAFRKKVNFSLLEEEAEEKEVITSFTANIEDTIPAWVRQVENMKKNRK